MLINWAQRYRATDRSQFNQPHARPRRLKGAGAARTRLIGWGVELSQPVFRWQIAPGLVTELHIDQLSMHAVCSWRCPKSRQIVRLVSYHLRYLLSGHAQAALHFNLSFGFRVP